MRLSRLSGLLSSGKIATVPPTFVGAGTTATDVSSSLRLYYPSGVQTGDLLILAVRSTVTSSVPSGWTSIYSYTFSQNYDCFLAYKYHTTGTYVNVSHTSGLLAMGVVIAFRGTATSSPIHVNTNNNISKLYPSLNGVTTTIDNCMICACALFYHSGTSNSNSNFSNWANPNLDSITEAVDQFYYNADSWPGGVGIAYGVKAAAGTTGDTTATASKSLSQSKACTFAIAPAA